MVVVAGFTSESGIRYDQITSGDSGTISNTTMIDNSNRNSINQGGNVDLTDAIYSITPQPPGTLVEWSVMPQPLQDLEGVCNTPGTCKEIDYNFVNDVGSTQSISAPYIVSSETTLQNDTAVLIKSNGTSLDRVTILNPGSGYTAVPAITITGTSTSDAGAGAGAGSGATATATIANGIITTITVTNGGSGYLVPPTITIEPPPVNSGGQTATAAGILLNPVVFISPPGYSLISDKVLNAGPLSGGSSATDIEECSIVCDSTTDCKGFNFSSIYGCSLKSSTTTTTPNDNSTIGFLAETIQTTLNASTDPVGADFSNSGYSCADMLQCNSDIKNVITNTAIKKFSTTDIKSCINCPVKKFAKTGTSTYIITNEIGTTFSYNNTTSAITKLQYTLNSALNKHKIQDGQYTIKKWISEPNSDLWFGTQVVSIFKSIFNDTILNTNGQPWTYADTAYMTDNTQMANYNYNYVPPVIQITSVDYVTDGYVLTAKGNNNEFGILSFQQCGTHTVTHKTSSPTQACPLGGTPPAGGCIERETVILSEYSEYTPQYNESIFTIIPIRFNMTQLNINGGNGSGAIAYAYSTTGSLLDSVYIINKGSGYTSVPTVTVISKYGYSMTATASISGDSVSQIVLNSSNNSYNIPYINNPNSYVFDSDSGIYYSVVSYGDKGVNLIPFYDEYDFNLVNNPNNDHGQYATNYLVNLGLDIQKLLNIPTQVYSGSTLLDVKCTIIDGMIISIKFINNTYKFSDPNSITIKGAGYGATAIGILDTLLGYVYDIKVTNRGNLYYSDLNQKCPTIWDTTSLGFTGKSGVTASFYNDLPGVINPFYNSCIANTIRTAYDGKIYYGNYVQGSMIYTSAAAAQSSSSAYNVTDSCPTSWVKTVWDMYPDGTAKYRCVKNSYTSFTGNTYYKQDTMNTIFRTYDNPTIFSTSYLRTTYSPSTAFSGILVYQRQIGTAYEYILDTSFNGSIDINSSLFSLTFPPSALNRMIHGGYINCKAGYKPNTNACNPNTVSCCTPCPLGTYKDNSMGTCVVCPVNTTTSGTGSTSISACNVTCPAGNSGDACTACPAGSYSTVNGCLPCAAWTSSIAGSSSCSRCPATYYSEPGGLCVQCTPGSNLNLDPQTGGHTCTPCYPGYYLDLLRIDASGIGLTFCSPCLSGTYSSAGATSCSACPSGKTSVAGSSSCITCPIGNYVQSTYDRNTQVYGQQCISCAAGSYNSSINSFSCTPCPAGKYSSLGASSCTACPAGTSFSGTGGASLSVCASCPAGTYSSAGASSCMACSAGTYNSTSGASACTSCPDGTSFSGVGGTSLSVCEPCPAGMGKVSNPPDPNCIAYPSAWDSFGFPTAYSGCSNTLLSKDSCHPCDAGTTSIIGGMCTPCPAGTSSSAGAPSCSSCPAGSYVTGNACNQCPSGSYSSAANSTSCTPCPAGTSFNGKGGTSLSVCSTCPAGEYSSAGSTSCTSCLAGTYNDSPGASSCTLCPTGTSSSTVGATACTPCLAGTANPTAGSTSCSACGHGYYSSVDEATSCTPCPAGTVMWDYGATTACSACQPGTFSTDRLICTPCPAGKYSSTLGASSCTACPAGTSFNGTGGTSLSVCASCTPGTYNSTSGASSCTACPAGTYSSAVGAISSSVCKTCTAGTSSAGSSSCTSCPAGSYITGNACNQCPSGSYSSTANSTSCTSCPAGTSFSGTGGASLSVCSTCPAGKYSLLGASSCTSCPAGTSFSGSSGTSLSVCTTCPSGKFSSAGSSSCTSCPAGTYNSTSGSSSCTVCPAGTAFSGTGGTSLSVCTSCPAGKYSSAGSSSCTSCPAGSYSSTSGASSCTLCPTGTFYNGTGATSLSQCAQCRANYYTGVTQGASSCTQCPTGTVSTAGSVSCFKY
jgi:hypothetical protein